MTVILTYPQNYIVCILWCINLWLFITRPSILGFICSYCFICPNNSHYMHWYYMFLMPLDQILPNPSYRNKIYGCSPNTKKKRRKCWGKLHDCLEEKVLTRNWRRARAARHVSRFCPGKHFLHIWLLWLHENSAEDNKLTLRKTDSLLILRK